MLQFFDWITQINNTQVGDAQKFDIVMPMYNLIEYSHARHQEVYGNTTEMNQL